MTVKTLSTIESTVAVAPVTDPVTVLPTENEFAVVRYPEGSRDIVVLNGVEPHLAWPTFTDCIIDVVRGLGVELVVSLGAAAEQVPQRRDMRVGEIVDVNVVANAGAIGRRVIVAE